MSVAAAFLQADGQAVLLLILLFVVIIAVLLALVAALLIIDVIRMGERNPYRLSGAQERRNRERGR